MDKEPICISDIYFEHYDNFVFDKEKYKDAYVISGEDLVLLYNKICAKDFRIKFFEEQHIKSIARYENKVDYYKNLAHIYKIELGRCVRKLTRIYKLLEGVRRMFFAYSVMGEIAYNDYDGIKTFIKEIKNV